MNNFSSQAQKFLSWVYDIRQEPGGGPTENILLLKEIIDSSVHFNLGDGKVFDDNFRGLQNSQLRLPFRYITISFVTDNKNQLVVATESLTDESAIYLRFFEQDSIGDMMLTFACFINKNFNENEITFNEDGDWDMKFQELDPESLEIIKHEIPYKVFTNKVFNQNIFGIVQSGIKATFELCEALQCSNVTSAPTKKIGPNVNIRRARDGKAKLYDTYTLFIDTNKRDSNGTVINLFEKNSPRQHLRRGHIRCYQTGLKVWVNSCVVGSAEDGVITKDYAFAERMVA